MRPLNIGPLRLWPPVLLAPMAGVTDAPFRALCRNHGAPLCVSEMITARPLVERNRKTLSLARFAPQESPRSLQLYGTDPYWIGEAVKQLVGDGEVDHIDMNFGCPMPKIMRRGGGAALPRDPIRLARIVKAAVSNAESVPVTIKFRMGIDEGNLTYHESGRVGQEEGCRAVTLHARTAAQRYEGPARWQAIAELKRSVTQIPVLGNGDIWEAEDAISMMRDTGCDGVVIGRGCLGRPWLFAELFARFSGDAQPPTPSSGEIAAIMIEHARLLCGWRGQDAGIRAFRKHANWYAKGLPNSANLGQKMMRLSALDELAAALAAYTSIDPAPTPSLGLTGPKGGGERIPVNTPPGATRVSGDLRPTPRRSKLDIR